MAGAGSRRMLLASVVPMGLGLGCFAWAIAWSRPGGSSAHCSSWWPVRCWPCPPTAMAVRARAADRRARPRPARPARRRSPDPDTGAERLRGRRAGVRDGADRPDRRRHPRQRDGGPRLGRSLSHGRPLHHLGAPQRQRADRADARRAGSADRGRVPGVHAVPMRFTRLPAGWEGAGARPGSGCSPWTCRGTWPRTATIMFPRCRPPSTNGWSGPPRSSSRRISPRCTGSGSA